MSSISALLAFCQPKNPNHKRGSVILRSCHAFMQNLMNVTSGLRLSWVSSYLFCGFDLFMLIPILRETFSRVPGNALACLHFSHVHRTQNMNAWPTQVMTSTPRFTILEVRCLPYHQKRGPSDGHISSFGGRGSLMAAVRPGKESCKSRYFTK